MLDVLAGQPGPQNPPASFDPEGRRGFVTSVALGARPRDGFVAIGVGNPASAQFPRPRCGTWSCPRPVPLPRTFALEDARGAVAILARAHPSGKLALVRGA